MIEFPHFHISVSHWGMFRLPWQLRPARRRMLDEPPNSQQAQEWIRKVNAPEKQYLVSRPHTDRRIQIINTSEKRW